MAESDHIVINIAEIGAGVTREGFGTALAVTYNPPVGMTERVRTYSSLAAVQVNFAAGTPEYLFAQAAFAQQPSAARVMIGRGELAPTMVYRITPAVINSKTYRLQFVAPGAVTTTVEYTSDATATAGEIAAGLLAAINGVVGKNFTATLDTDDVLVTADAPGNWFAIDLVDDLTSMEIDVEHVDPGIATDLAAIALEDSSWYGLYTLYNSTAMAAAAAAWAEANEKLYALDLSHTAAANTAASSGTDPAKTLNDLNYRYVHTQWSPQPSQMFGARWPGLMFAKDPGTATWKWKTLSGLAAFKLTGTQRNNLIDRNMNIYESTKGASHTSEGTVLAGTFIDSRRGRDALADRVVSNILDALLVNDKIPHHDSGYLIVEAAIREALDFFVETGFLNPDYTVTIPPEDEVPAIDKADRVLRGVRFDATEQGAVHAVIPVTGTILF